MSVPIHSVALHLGALHPYEQLLVLVIAFGPFVVLGIVVYVARRRAISEEAADEEADQPPTVVENEVSSLDLC